MDTKKTVEIIAVANQKGGIAKTTTTHAMAAGLVDLGYRVAAIDLDPQGNFSAACNVQNYNVPTVYELMKREVAAQDVIQHCAAGFDVIPANILLAGIGQELPQARKEYRLKEMVSPIMDLYDFILIDTPPALDILTVNAFTLATKILIPSQAAIFAASGIGQLSNTIMSVKKRCNPNVTICGILLTMYNPRTILAKQMRQVTEQLSQEIGAPVYKTFIRSAVAVQEAQLMRTDIFEYQKNSTVALDYACFIQEFLGHDISNFWAEHSKHTDAVPATNADIPVDATSEGGMM